MFTGIVEETGTVERIKPTAKSIELTVWAKLCGRGLKVGASLAINGCCLTVVKLTTRGKSTLAQFDLLKETWVRTNLQFARAGSLVNLERPLRTDGTLSRDTLMALAGLRAGKEWGKTTCWISPRRRR